MSPARPEAQRIGLARLRRDRRGVAALEFGLLAPALLLLLLAGFDMVQTLRAQLRVEAVATQLGQIVSRCERLVVPGDTNLLWGHGQRIIGSLGLLTNMQTNGVPNTTLQVNGGIIVTAVYGQPGARGVPSVNRVAWQQRTGDPNIRSSVGTAERASLATIASGFIVPPGQTLLVTEIFLPRPAWVLSADWMGGAMPHTLRTSTLFLSRAPDAAAVQAVPITATTPDCLA